MRKFDQLVSRPMSWIKMLRAARLHKMRARNEELKRLNKQLQVQIDEMLSSHLSEQSGTMDAHAASRASSY